MDLDVVRSFSSKHRKQVQESDSCSCFHCLESFPPADIAEWIDEGQTALCPRCGIDAVIGCQSGVILSPDLLKAMKAAWF